MISAALISNNGHISSLAPSPSGNMPPSCRPNSDYSTLNGLPKQFVNSMMTLFNILDEAGTGFVPLVEIERRWREDAVPNLPGVLDALRTVAPRSGMLSFENFVYGLRTALARVRKKDDVPFNHHNRNVTFPQKKVEQSKVVYTEMHYPSKNGTVAPNVQVSHRTRPLRHRRSNSGPVSTAVMILANRRASPVSEMEVDVNFQQQTQKVTKRIPCNQSPPPQDCLKSGKVEKSELDNLTANTLFVNPKEVTRPINLSGKLIGITGHLKRAKSTATPHCNSLHRPQRNGSKSVLSKSASCFPIASKSSAKSAILSKTANADITNRSMVGASDRKRAVDDIRKEMVKSKSEGQVSEGIGRRCNSYSPPQRPVVKSARSSKGANVQQTAVKSSNERQEIENKENRPRDQTNTGLDTKNNTKSSLLPASVRRRASNLHRRREMRRHTVTNGVDYNVLKCVKQLDEERELLAQGIEAAEISRSWFQKQLSLANDKYKFVTESGAMRTNFTSLKLSNSSSLHGMSAMQNNLSEELWSGKSLAQSQKLVALLATSISSLNNINLSLQNDSKPVSSGKFSNFLSSTQNTDQQNAALTQQVTLQAGKILKLEQEKSELVKQLFQTKAEAQGEVDTSIFI